MVVTDIGEYINQHSCERSFKLRLNKAEVARRYPFYPTVRSPLNPILAERGREREMELEERLGRDLVLLNPGREEEGRIPWAELLNQLGGAAPARDVFAREVEIEGQVGEFTLSGRMDFVVLRWVDGVPWLRIVECKASRRDKTYQRIQLAAYRIMVSESLQESGLNIGGRAYRPVIESVVARIDESTNDVQDALSLPSLGLEEEMEDLRRLLAPGGPLSRIAATELDELAYRLEGKCEMCVHCPICMAESARQRRLELLGEDAATVRSLRASGISDIDALADLDPRGERASKLRATAGFTSDLDDLIGRAKARRSTLSGRREGDWEVMSRHHVGPGLVPSHGDEQPLIRVFLDVEYDYIEDRLVGLAAHVTDSPYTLLTAKGDRPDPTPRERAKDGTVGSLKAQETVSLITGQWSGEVGQDDLAEGAMITNFFNALVDAIVRTGRRGERPIHFYTWSQGDMAHLIEACARAGGPLLHHLTELLGCRAECQGELEQTIFTPLGAEIDHRFLLGYTGLSPAVAASLSWFGYPRFHWVRMVGNEDVDLAKVFRRDIFDFRTALYQARGEWAERDRPGAQAGWYEVRTRYSSDITSPYWYALWGALPQARGRDNMLPRALADYKRAGAGTLISTFLVAKCQALRWLEERLYQNPRLAKPPVPLGELRTIGDRFAGRYDLVSASLDFLRLDHHVRKIEWLRDSLRSPGARVGDGSAVPLRNIFTVDGNSSEIGAEVDLERFLLDRRSFFSTCTIGEGGFVRIVPYRGDLDAGPAIHEIINQGLTARVTLLNPDHGAFKAEVIAAYSSARGRYLLPSNPARAEDMTLALAGESMADFVRSRVDAWLDGHRASPIARWFDPRGPVVPLRAPLPPEETERLADVLGAMKARGRSLDEVQVKACLDGLGATVQLLLGPPGTGKTNTAAAAILVRLASQPRKKLFLLSANTHTAVDELTNRIRELLPDFRRAADLGGVAYNVPMVLKLTRDPPRSEEEVGTWDTHRIGQAREMGDLVLCGTIGEVLKVAEAHKSVDLNADGLIVDEASMMVFADFLALATLLGEGGEIMLAGDHRQLAPITSHDWDAEDREQMVVLAPHQSAYRAVDRLVPLAPPGSMVRSALDVTYRLTPELTHLITGVYEEDGVVLRSKKPQDRKRGDITSLSDLWANPGVYLVVHDESSSRRVNMFEAQLIKDIMLARGAKEHDVPPETVSIITPHRAQRGLLKEELEEFNYHLRLVDTVERLQGGECETILVSGTQSDPGAISGNAEFILDLNRTNVIFSRAQERLVVVCSRNLMDSIPADTDEYASSWLWKHLRSVCDTTALSVTGYPYNVEVRVPGRFWNR